MATATYPVHLTVDYDPGRRDRVGAVLATIVSWVSILITGHHPESLQTFVVEAYALALVTDSYPPFRLAEWRR